ncbi:hypothetical protein Baya_12730 [Bagarius yarrelli]|uniref:Uncharacterized protein n=1 Tax=Bagarius yarrelli TaxID=175774 RepID=A0A556V3T2_BAGYA|nr:hypothetical protein Baya_12730 [Bagarius yarrelli]
MGDTGNEPWLDEAGCEFPSCGLVRDNCTGTIIQWANHVVRRSTQGESEPMDIIAHFYLPPETIEELILFLV